MPGHPCPGARSDGNELGALFQLSISRHFLAKHLGALVQELLVVGVLREQPDEVFDFTAAKGIDRLDDFDLVEIGADSDHSFGLVQGGQITVYKYSNLDKAFRNTWRDRFD